MIAGCYSLDLYCDALVPHALGAFPAQYTAETGAVCRDEARADGWRIHLRYNLAICPKCAKAGQTLSTVRAARIRQRAQQAQPSVAIQGAISEGVPFGTYVPGEVDPSKTK